MPRDHVIKNMFRLFYVTAFILLYILCILTMRPQNNSNVEKNVEDCLALSRASRKRKGNVKARKTQEISRKTSRKYRSKSGGEDDHVEVNAVEVDSPQDVGMEETGHANSINGNVDNNSGDEGANLDFGNAASPDLEEEDFDMLKEEFHERDVCKLVDEHSVMEAPFPKKERSIKCFIKEINNRGNLCIKRNQLDVGKRLYVRGIECLSGCDESIRSLTEPLLLSLYLSCCQISFLADDEVGELERFADKAISLSPCSYQAKACKALLESTSLADVANSAVGDDNGSSENTGGGVDADAGAVNMNEEMVLSDSDFSWSHILIGGCEKCCDNCRRNQITMDPRDPYYFDMYQVWTNNLRQCRNPLKDVIAARKRETARLIHLCTECHSFLSASSPGLSKVADQDRCHNSLCSKTAKDAGVKLDQCTRCRSVRYCCENCKAMDYQSHTDFCTREVIRRVKEKKRLGWGNVWPSFYWNLLMGSEDMTTKTKFHVTYEPEELWRYIPRTVRRYWLKRLKDLNTVKAAAALYEGCDVDEPEPYFMDHTKDVRHFWQSIKSYTFEGMLRVLDPSRLNNRDNKKASMIIPDVLCPWGCCEFPFRTTEINPAY